MRRLFSLLLLLIPTLVFGQAASFQTVITNGQGQPLVSVSASVCQGLQTTAASIASNTVTLTMSSNPLTAGFTPGSQIAVYNFTGADALLNSSLVNGILGTYTILTVTSTQITYALVNNPYTASSNGFVVQQGTNSCLPLATTFTDATGSNTVSVQSYKSDGRGNFGFFGTPGALYVIEYSGSSAITSLFEVVLGGGGGGGGGSGTVGPCATLNSLAKFNGLTTVLCSSVTDDGINPTIAPNGMNVGSSGYNSQFIAGPAGVTANSLVCRTPTVALQVVNCPAGATLTVLGVAKGTVASGGQVILCQLAHCPVTVSNITTQNDILIPSATVPGQMDDIGPSIPTTKTFFAVAELSALAGTLSQITFLASDTLAAGGGGTGTVNPALQFSEPYYSGAGSSSVISGISPPTLNGAVFGSFWKPTGVGVIKQVNQFGVLPRALAASDSIAVPDIAPGSVECNLTLCTVTVPDIGSTGFANGPVFKAINGNGTTTFNRTSASQFRVANGANSNLVTSFSLSSGASAVFQKDADGTDWLVTTSGAPSFSGNFSSGVFYGIPSTYTLVNADNTNRLNVTGVGNAVITLPKPGTVALSPLVGLKFNSNVSGLSTFTSGSYTQTAGNQLYVVFIQGGSNQTVTSISDSRGDSLTPLTGSSDTLAGNAIYYCNNLLTSGSTTFTINFSGAIGGNSLIFAYELTGTSHDNSSSSSQNGSVTLPLTNAIHFQQAIALAGGRTAPIIPAGPFVELDTVANGNIGEVYYRLLSNQGSSTVQMPGNNTTVFQSILSITGVPLFVGGYYVIITNTTAGVETLTPTASTIDGFGSLPLYPNETCTLLSNGTNWDSICGFAPDTASVTGGNVTIYATDQTAGTTSIGATNMLAPTASTPISRFMVSGYADVTSIGASCAGATTVVLNAIFTDPNGAGTTTKALGTFTISSNGNNGTLGDNFSYPPIYFKAKVSTNIQFSTTYTAGGSCSPAPTVQVTPILQAL